MAEIRVFDYVPDLDCFVVNPEYERIAEELNISDWNPVVWIGRLFFLDNDYGEHWFDNEDERDELAARARNLGYDSGRLMIVVPDRFTDGRDGPCHSDELRKRFWTDVLKGLTLDLETIFAYARENNEGWKEHDEEFPGDAEFVPDLEVRIESVRNKYR